MSAGDYGYKLQDSNDDSTYTDVADADMVDNGLPATAAATSVYKVSYVGNKRYLQVAQTKNGGTSIVAGAVAILGHAAQRPVA